MGRSPATLVDSSFRHPHRARGWNSISLSVSQEGNAAARLLYAKLGYVDAGRSRPGVRADHVARPSFDVDDTLVYLRKPL